MRQSERHIDADPPTDEELDALRGDVAATLADAVPEDRAPGGGARDRGGRHRDLAGRDRPAASSPTTRRGSTATGSTPPPATAIRDELSAMPLAERREVAGLHPDRAPTIIPGVLILECVMELFGLDAVEVSEHDILRGAALGLAARERVRRRAGAAPRRVGELLPLDARLLRLLRQPPDRRGAAGDQPRR